MRNIFRYSYFTFVASLWVMLLFSITNIISFGIDIGNSLTQLIIVVILVASIPIFWLTIKLDPTKTYAKVYKVCLILLMALIVYYLINDAWSHTVLH